MKKGGCYKMNVCIFYYDSFCEFEVVLSAAEFSSQNLISVALENKIYISEEKQRFILYKVINDIDLFIIPGGNPSYLYESSVLKDFIKAIMKIYKNKEDAYNVYKWYKNIKG